MLSLFTADAPAADNKDKGNFFVCAFDGFYYRFKGSKMGGTGWGAIEILTYFILECLTLFLI